MNFLVLYLIGLLIVFVSTAVFYGTRYARCLMIILEQKTFGFPEFVLEVIRLDGIHIPRPPSFDDYVCLFPVWIFYLPIAFVLGQLRRSC